MGRQGGLCGEDECRKGVPRGGQGAAQDESAGLSGGAMALSCQAPSPLRLFSMQWSDDYFHSLMKTPQGAGRGAAMGARSVT